VVVSPPVLFIGQVLLVLIEGHEEMLAALGHPQPRDLAHRLVVFEGLTALWYFVVHVGWS